MKGRALVRLAVAARFLAGIAPRITEPLLRLPGVAARWQAASRFQRDLVVNMAVCLLLTLAVQWGSTTPWLQPMSDSALDWALKQRADSSRSVTQGRSAPFVMIDIDADTQEAWGAPPYVRRDKLAIILGKVLATQPAPKLVIVNVAMGRRTGIDDQPLREMLERRLREPGMPPLILIRDLRPPAKAGDCPSPRLSALDDVVAAAKGRVFWSSPLFSIDEDHTVRRWRAFETTATDPLPGVEQLAYAIAAGDRAAAEPPASADPGCAAAQTAAMALSHRILYAISWHADIRPTVDGAPIVESIPALWLSESGPEVVPDQLGSKIVIVGVSHADARDIHQTPLGPMPGSLIIANAIHSRLTFGEAHAPPLWETLLIQAGLVTLIGALFARFSAFLAMMLSATAALVLLVPLGLVLFDSGVWLNFALPTFVVQAHQVIAEFGERMRRKEAKQE